MVHSFFGQYERNDESYVTDDDIERLAGLPVDESLRAYIGLRNFNDKYPAYINVMCLGPTKSMVATGDRRGTWVPEFTSKCANVVLDCYLTRLKAANRSSSTQWNANVAKMAVELPTGIAQWDDSKRKKYARMVAVIMRFLSDCERYKVSVSDDPSNEDKRNAIENFLESGRVELSRDARCPFMDFLAAFKGYVKEYGKGNFRMDKQFLKVPLERRNARIVNVKQPDGATKTFVDGLRLVATNDASSDRVF
jgi:hypothetical protein